MSSTDTGSTPITPETVRAFCESVLVREADAVIAERCNTRVSDRLVEEPYRSAEDQAKAKGLTYLGFTNLESFQISYQKNLDRVVDFTVWFFMDCYPGQWDIPPLSRAISVHFCCHYIVITNPKSYVFRDYYDASSTVYSNGFSQEGFEDLLRFIRRDDDAPSG